jgi:hypothetical protein
MEYGRVWRVSGLGYKTNNCSKLKHLQHLKNEKATQFARTIQNPTIQDQPQILSGCKANPKEKLIKKFD